MEDTRETAEMQTVDRYNNPCKIIHHFGKWIRVTLPNDVAGQNGVVDVDRGCRLQYSFIRSTDQAFDGFPVELVKGSTVCEIMSFFTTHRERERGYGRLAMQALLSWLRFSDKNCKHVVLDAWAYTGPPIDRVDRDECGRRLGPEQEQLESFYSSFGFLPIRRAPSGAVIMMLDLLHPNRKNDRPQMRNRT